MRHFFQKYNDYRYRVRHNIFAFERHTPSFNHFDVTSCFYEDALAHRSIRLGWEPDLVVEQDILAFEHEVRKNLHLAADISPFRVQNIEVRPWASGQPILLLDQRLLEGAFPQP